MKLKRLRPRSTTPTLSNTDCVRKNCAGGAPCARAVSGVTPESSYDDRSSHRPPQHTPAAQISEACMHVTRRLARASPAAACACSLAPLRGVRVAHQRGRSTSDGDGGGERGGPVHGVRALWRRRGLVDARPYDERPPPSREDPHGTRSGPGPGGHRQTPPHRMSGQRQCSSDYRAAVTVSSHYQRHASRESTHFLRGGPRQHASIHALTPTPP
jgi:hypothetical protein